MRDLVVVSYGGTSVNDGTSYVAGFSTGQEWGLPPTAARTVKRSGAWPVLGSVDRPAPVLNIVVQIVGANVRALRDQLLRLFDPESETPRALVVRDVSGSNERYVETLCERMHPLTVGSNSAADVFVATLVVVGDPRWRSTTLTTDTWSITASGQTRVINNAGTDDAYPVIRVRPSLAKGSGYAYHRFVTIVWRSVNAAASYPVCLTLDTQALINAGKMRSDGNDLRVLVDGVDVDRWVSGINTTSTKVWFALNFQSRVVMTLKTAIPSAGSIDSIDVNESIDDMPERGMLLIDSEVFTYTGRMLSERRFTNVTRAAKRTSMAAHSAGTAVQWLQREVWLLYGNATASPLQVNNSLAPIFSMSASTNSSWLYEQFSDTEAYRSGRWSTWGIVTLSGQGGCYSVTQRGGVSSPYEVAGAWIATQHGSAYGWYLYHPCGITGLTWANGLRRRAGSGFTAHCMNWPRGAGWWNWHYSLPAPSSANTWEAWTWSGTFGVSDFVGIALYFVPSDVEVGAATVTINSSEAPTVTVGSEFANYSLSSVIANETTGERIEISFAMNSNSELEVDCYSRTVTYLLDNSRQLSALTVPAGQRHWLRLAPGFNTLRFTDAGTQDVTVTTQFRRRFY